MGRLLIGTCSWTDPTLLASGFYPKGVNSAEKRLGYYARHFSLVEVDSTYYALPGERTTRLWVERTPPGFVLDIKAFSLFTGHPTPREALPRDLRALASSGESRQLKDVPQEVQDALWRAFERALLPLDSAGKLGVVLFQFPPWFHPGREAKDYLLSCQGRLPQYRLAVEFRNGWWLGSQYGEDTLKFLREHQLILVAVDEPQGFPTSVPPVAEATTDIAVVRFHGRNRDNWEKPGITAAERFRYLYSREELSGWLPAIHRLSAECREVHLLFNNCYADYGVRNARDMGDLMRAQPLLFPDLLGEGRKG